MINKKLLLLIFGIGLFSQMIYSQVYETTENNSNCEMSVDLRIAEPNIEICKCELTKYLSNAFKWQNGLLTPDNRIPNDLQLSKIFVIKCNKTGYFDNYDSLTQEEFFRYGKFSNKVSPFQGDAEKKLKYKDIVKMLTGQSKLLIRPNPFMLPLSELEN